MANRGAGCMGKPLVRFCEGQECNCDMEVTHTVAFSHGSLLSTRKNWSIGKRKSGCEGFQEPSLNNNALTIERAVPPSLHHSITP